jgi:hypothetical protein
MTDTLSRPDGVDQFAAHLGGRTDIGVGLARYPEMDYSVVVELLVGGQRIPIQRGSFSGVATLLRGPNGPQAFLTFVHADGTPGSVVREALFGLAPLEIVKPPEPYRPPARPPQIECASPRCTNLVSRQGQHCETCCSRDCTCDVDQPTITPEERHEALFLANDYEKAAARSNGVEVHRFRLMAEEQRTIAARPVREADPVVEPEPELDRGQPLSNTILKPPKNS